MQEKKQSKRMITVRMENDTYEALTAFAKKENRTISNAINTIISKYINNRP